MAGYGNIVWPRSSYERTVQTGIGRVIRDQLDSREPLPKDLCELLQQLEQSREEPAPPHS